MKFNRLLIIALVIALILHISIALLLVRDEKNRIIEYQSEEVIPVTVIPPPENDDLSEEIPDEPILDASNDSQSMASNPQEESEEMVEAMPEESSNSESNEASTEDNSSEKLDEQPDDEQESEPVEPAYKRNLTAGGDLMQQNILPPKEDGEYRRVVTTDDDPYQKMVENAIHLLQDTPFLDKKWKESPEDEEAPTYYSAEFMEFVKKYNPQEPIQKESLDTTEPPAPETEDVANITEFESDKPVTLIATFIDIADEKSITETKAVKSDAELEKQLSTNILNAATSQIRRLEYNVSLKSSQCYERYIKGQNRRFQVAVMIFENPLRTGIFRSSGNDGLDRCVVEMTNELIKIPAEMERIRKFAPRMNEAYLLNATF